MARRARRSPDPTSKGALGRPLPSRRHLADGEVKIRRRNVVRLDQARRRTPLGHAQDPPTMLASRNVPRSDRLLHEHHSERRTSSAVQRRITSGGRMGILRLGLDGLAASVPARPLADDQPIRRKSRKGCVEVAAVGSWRGGCRSRMDRLSGRDADRAPQGQAADADARSDDKALHRTDRRGQADRAPTPLFTSTDR